jgi:hypothetical protein
VKGADGPVLSTNLSCCAGLRSDLCAEGVDFFDDELFHPLDRILLFESKIEFLETWGSPSQ